MSAPKVFISHASEDKERFVIPFATELRTKGIDAWVDAWEMRPGDSLVDKISQAIKEAEALVIVLSKTSIQKPWVREELNTAIVKRISNQYRIIPMVLDDCEIPELLQSILYVRVDDLTDVQRPARAVINAVLNVSDKPPLGSPLISNHDETAPAIMSSIPPHPRYQYLDRPTLLGLIAKQQQNLTISLNQEKAYGKAQIPLHLINQIDGIIEDMNVLRQELERRE